MNPKYPIYIPSKGRWASRLTMKSLDKMNLSYKIVIEEQEYDNYANVIDKNKILVLPFSNKHLIASRCWIMEHSISLGYERHWQLDDNINGFIRLNRNTKIPVSSGNIFRAAEDFCDRYTNVALSGFNYRFFAKQRQLIPPYYLNTRIYSCTLVNNFIPYRWRSIYNDDTDISLQALKGGWCTILFNAFLCNKAATMSVKGGNTDYLYKIQDGRLKMAEAIVELHPDVARLSKKFNRWQHHVDYRSFQNNKLIKKPDIIVEDKVNNYGMVLKTVNKNKLDGYIVN